MPFLSHFGAAPSSTADQPDSPYFIGVHEPIAGGLDTDTTRSVLGVRRRLLGS